MRHRNIHRVTGIILSVGAALVVAASSAHADDEPREDRAAGRPKIEVLKVNYDPNLSYDARVTDAMEQQDVTLPGQTCTYENPQTGVNPAPTSPSFQLLYVVPADVTPNNALDVPRSCSDGATKASALGRASRNLATWQDRRGAGLHYRTQNISYVHNYTGSTYATRGVRRYVSEYLKGTWESLWMYNEGDPNDPYDDTSPRLDRLAAELSDAGFAVTNTRYEALLSVDAEYVCDSQGCGYTAGVATTPGKYGLVTRTYPTSTGDKVIRYGCASTDGDAFLGHEMTHQVGADHVSDDQYDLMTPSKANANFNTSPYLRWDTDRSSYHSIVYNSVYVVRSSLPGSYFTC